MLAALCILQLCSSCNGSSNPQRRFKDESPYFMALRAADANDERTAIRLFTEGRKKGTSLTSRRCAEALTQLGNVTERLDACRYLIANWNDDLALVTACTEFERNNELSLIIASTDGIDLATANNELVRLRMNALFAKGDSRFESEAYRWMMSRALSASHLEVYSKYLEPLTRPQEAEAPVPLLTQEQVAQRIANFASEADSTAARAAADAAVALISPAAAAEQRASQTGAAESADRSLSLQQRFLKYRVEVYRRSYALPYKEINSVLQLCEDGGEPLPPLLVSDMGKAALYGTGDSYGAARLFDRIAARLYKRVIAANETKAADATTTDMSGTSADAAMEEIQAANTALFYANFYAGRLYDKAGHYPSYMTSRFKSAMEASTDGTQYDNALWYLLNAQLRGDPAGVISSLKTYSGTWHDPAYFDDFFESLSVLLISHHQWQDFYDVWLVIDKSASEETACKYAYLAGRLLEEGLARDADNPPTRQAVAAFTRVLSGGAALYYKVCALERMNILDDDVIESALCDPTVSADGRTFDAGAEAFIAACASFGFPQRIYDEWLHYRDNLHTAAALQAGQFLSQCGQYDTRYNVQSLRIASRAKEYAYERIPRELLALDFPRFYADIVSPAAAENEVTEALLYALIRSESFFDPDVSSHSGAQGLTQLMLATANDVARKLKVDDYDILDPATNVRFGAYYLGELMGRVDGLPLLAIFAYNAGLTNVRRWVRQTRSDWLMSYRSRHAATGISPDLFLETLPFTETREYGRKIVSAAALYGWLYYDTPPSETVRALMQ